MRRSACRECGTWNIVAYVMRRGRYSNGHRATTKREPICGTCAVRLCNTYDLDAEAERGDIHGLFVEGWHAEGLMTARDHDE